MDQHAVAERILTTFPVYLVRRLAAPAVLGAIAPLIAAYFMHLLQRTREPTLPKMSDDWLRTHDRDAGHSDQRGGFSW